MMLTAVVLLAQLGVNGPAIDSAVMAGIDARVYPGAVVVIGRRDTVLHVRAYGRFTFDAGARAVDSDSTLFDLASLTKVVATTTAIMLLADDGRLDVDAPVSRYLPRFSGDEKTAVTVRQLLAHTSGLPAYRPFYERAENRDSMIAMVYREPLQRPPDRMAVYSDLNAILLGDFAAVQGYVLVLAVFSVAVFIVIDLMVLILEPRATLRA